MIIISKTQNSARLIANYLKTQKGLEVQDTSLSMSSFSVGDGVTHLGYFKVDNNILVWQTQPTLFSIIENFCKELPNDIGVSEVKLVEWRFPNSMQDYCNAFHKAYHQSSIQRTFINPVHKVYESCTKCGKTWISEAVDWE